MTQAVGEVTLIHAVRAALTDEMATDERVMMLGQDVGQLGGVFRATEGIHARFPDRVFDTPLAEGAIVGSAIGLAMGGLVPVAEIQFLGFVHQAFHQISQQLARYRFRSRGRFPLPVTIRAPYGGGLRMPEFHPDSLESQLVNIPGLKVFAPSTPEDAYTMLRAAIQDPDPVIFLEPQRLYRSVRGPLPDRAPAAGDHGVRLRREGNDVLLVAWGPAVPTCLQAADQLNDDGLSAAVLDLRSLSPLDRDGLTDAARLRHRVVVVHEGVRTAGMGAEIIATLQERLPGQLQTPILRVTAPDTPYPPGRLEDHFLPTPQAVADAARDLVATR